MILSQDDFEGKYWAEHYRRWHASGDIPEALDREVVGNLRSKRWQQEYDAAAELYTRSLFEDLSGLNFEFHPLLQDKTPDFRLWTKYRTPVLADVKVLHNGPISYSAKQQKDYVQLAQEANDIATDHFATDVLSIEGTRSVVGINGGTVAVNKILSKIRATANRLENTYCDLPDLLTWEPQYLDKMRSATRHIAFRELEISLELQVAFYLRSDETVEHRRLRDLKRQGKLGVASSYCDQPARRLRVAIDKKVSYLSEFNVNRSRKDQLPYVVVIFDTDSMVLEQDLETALYGPSEGYDLAPRSLNEDLYEWQQRNSLSPTVSYGEGLFMNRKKEFLAVLMCSGNIQSPLACEMSMWLNPYASISYIPQPLFRLKTYSLSRRIVCTPSA